MYVKKLFLAWVFIISIVLLPSKASALIYAKDIANGAVTTAKLANVAPFALAGFANNQRVFHADVTAAFGANGTTINFPTISFSPAFNSTPEPIITLEYTGDTTFDSFRVASVTTGSMNVSLRQGSAKGTGANLKVHAFAVGN